MNPERFRNSTSGRIVKARYNNEDYWAFVPNPLPPSIIPDMELMQALSDAATSLGELSGLGRNIPNPQLLIRPFIRREAALSSRIEGTQADVVDVYAYEAGQPSLPGLKSPVPEADVKEVVNYVQALEYGLDRIQTLPIGMRLIRDLHAILLDGVRGSGRRPGEFRTDQNWIGGRNPQEADYVPPPALEVEGAFRQLEQYLHSEDSLPPLMRLALIHYQFEAIHPFYDGNGRIGRLLVSLLLVSWKLLPLPLLYLSAYFEKHREHYCDLLLAVSERGAWRDWLLFFLRGVADQSKDAGNRAKQLQDLQTEWKHQLQQQENVSGWMLDVIDAFFELPVRTSTEIRERCHKTNPTVISCLERFAKMGVLREVTGKERNRIYVSEPIIRVIQ